MDSNRIWKIALRILPAALIFISGTALLHLFMPREISGDSILRPDTPEIVAVLSHIKSRWPADIRKRDDRINSMYASYALENVETE